MRALLLVLSLILTCWLPCAAGTISVQWDPVPGAEDYVIYMGQATGDYTDTVETGATTSTVLTVDDCTEYFLAIKARNAEGESANYSNEISGWARPVPQQVSCEQPLLLNTTTTCVIDGANFRPSATAGVVGAAGLTVSDVSVISCNQIAFSLTVGPDAPGGPVDLDVVNPSMVYGELAAALEIVRGRPTIVIGFDRWDRR